MALSVKYQMIANLYQQAYFTEEMPRPHIGEYFLELQLILSDTKKKNFGRWRPIVPPVAREECAPNERSHLLPVFTRSRQRQAGHHFSRNGDRLPVPRDLAYKRTTHQ